jgi:two-component system response regulator HydG
VLQLSDSFASLWEEIGSEFGLTVEVTTSADAFRAPRSIGIVAAGGDEDRLAETLQSLTPSSPVIAIGASTSHRVALAAVRAGAADYFALPPDIELVRAWVKERAARLSVRDNRSRFADRERAKYSFEGIFGESPALRQSLALAERVIPHAQVTVLITGETGTGKELLARAIHYQGPRREGPFVDLNCAVIPEQLLESELCGHEKGAFTGATSAKPGLFEVASGGTLFLDEIGHLALQLQGKLLRALEERTIRRVGGQRTIPVDVRVIAATHVNLEQAVHDGRFRADLFHRLNVIPLELPPLRHRSEDIVPLARRFLDKLGRDYAMETPVLTVDAERALRSHDWPGNVRELRNAMERVLLLATDGHLTEHDFAFLVRSPGTTRADASMSGSLLPFPSTIHELVRAAATEMIAVCGGNKSEAARRLGISRPRLQRLLTSTSPLDSLSGDLDVVL